MTLAMAPVWQANDWPGQRVLVLGCGVRPVRGAVNLDRWRIGDWVDVAHDLDQMPWPAPDGGRFDTIVALDVVEHLADVGGALNECWALLREGGQLVMRVVASDNPAAWRDFTHRHVFTDESMDFVTYGHPYWATYGAVYLDSLGRPLRPWTDVKVRRVNPDSRWPAQGDWLFTMTKVVPE